MPQEQDPSNNILATAERLFTTLAGTPAGIGVILFAGGALLRLQRATVTTFVPTTAAPPGQIPGINTGIPGPLVPVKTTNYGFDMVVWSVNVNQLVGSGGSLGSVTGSLLSAIEGAIGAAVPGFAQIAQLLAGAIALATPDAKGIITIRLSDLFFVGGALLLASPFIQTALSKIP